MVGYREIGVLAQLMAMQISATIAENRMEVPQKLKVEQYSAVLLLIIYLREMKLVYCRDTVLMFIAVLFTIAEK